MDLGHVSQSALLMEIKVQPLTYSLSQLNLATLQIQDGAVDAMKPASPFSRMPNEIFLLITDTMQVRDVAALARVNRHFHNLINPVLYSKDAKFGNSSALAFAASNGRMNVARFSISRGGDPNAQDGNILFSAIENQDLDMTQLLLRCGANPNSRSKTSEGLPPLLWLLKPRNWGAYDNLSYRYSSPSPACHDPNERERRRILKLDPLLRVLLQYHPNTNGVDENGSTALHFVANWGCHELTELFLRNGADIEAQDSNGHTPLFRAVMNNYFEAARVLLAYNANTESRPGLGMDTPLLLALHSENRPANCMTKLLLEYGADPQAPDKYGNTPLHVAARVGETDIGRQLIEMGVDVNRLNDRQETALQIAAAAQHVSIIEMILRHDPDPYCRSVFEKTELVGYGQGVALTLLATKGLDGRRLANIMRGY